MPASQVAWEFTWLPTVMQLREKSSMEDVKTTRFFYSWVN